MRNFDRRASVFILSIALTLPLCAAADSQFDMDAYTRMLSNTAGLTADGLLSQYPADTFTEYAAGLTLDDTEFGPQIDAHYSLTPGEKSLLLDHGFVVTERHSRRSFANALLEIFHADLPVFVSTDSILHAVHMSYEDILETVEVSVLTPMLASALSSLHGQLPILADQYAAEPRLTPMLMDVDVYLTVARTLLGEPVQPQYDEVVPAVDAMLAGVASQGLRRYPLFSSTPRDIDFSQFTPRSHYTKSVALTRYFQAMMWLGRTELYLSAPKQHDPDLQQKPEDIQRQTIASMLIVEAAEAGDAIPALRDIDDTLRALVGEQDNVTLAHLRALADETGIETAADLLDVPREGVKDSV